MSEVKSYKLISGEEILTQVSDETETTVRFDRPMMIGVIANPDGQGGSIQMVPWLLGDQEGHAIVNKNNIVATFEPNTKLRDGYLEKTTGIQVVHG